MILLDLHLTLQNIYKMHPLLKKHQEIFNSTSHLITSLSNDLTRSAFNTTDNCSIQNFSAQLATLANNYLKTISFNNLDEITTQVFHLKKVFESIQAASNFDLNSKDPWRPKLISIDANKLYKKEESLPNMLFGFFSSSPEKLLEKNIIKIVDELNRNLSKDAVIEIRPIDCSV